MTDIMAELHCSIFSFRVSGNIKPFTSTEGLCLMRLLVLEKKSFHYYIFANAFFANSLPNTIFGLKYFITANIESFENLQL